MFFAIPNLSSQTAQKIKSPWDMPAAPQEQLDSGKVKFSEWCMEASTKHCFFNMAEGMDPLRRISDKDGNRVVALHGFVADIDREIPDEHFTTEYIIKKAKSEFHPNYMSRTHSGNGRLVWTFPVPVYVPNQEAATAFYEHMATQLKVKSIWGTPDPASFKANQYYERGREWKSITNDQIPVNFLETWLFESGRKIDYTDAERELQIPWDAINTKFHETFPGKWSGKIEEGARGPAFWRDTKSGNSAVVRKGGIQDFGGDFKTWSSLLGSAWVDKIYADRIGGMLTKVWFDGQKFYDFDPTNPGPFCDHTQGNMERMLKVEYNLSSTRLDGKAFSQLDEVMVRAMKKRVAGAGPFLHFPPGLIRVNSEIFLNDCFVRPIEPAPDPIEITGGPNMRIKFGHNFPFLASFLVQAFPKDKDGLVPLEFLLSWMRYAYANAYHCKPKPGQVVLTAGAQDSGKTLLIDGIMAQLLGGMGSEPARPMHFATGKTSHNEDLVTRAIWSVDDESIKTEREHAEYSNFIKTAVAWNSQRVNPKYKKATTVKWAGRVMVALNLDGRSARLLPDPELSLTDKIMMFRIAKTPNFSFPHRDQMAEILQKELPHLARWLLNWSIPAHCVGSTRFGVKSYHDPALLRAAFENGSNYEFFEVMKLFLRNFNSVNSGAGKTVNHWTGSSGQLHLELTAWNATIARDYSSRSIGRVLGDLMNRGLNIQMARTAHDRIWTIPVNLELELGGDSADDGNYDVEPLSLEDIEKINTEAATAPL